MGYWDAVPSISKMYGYIWMEYEVEFIEPSDNRNYAGVTLLLADPTTLSVEDSKKLSDVKAKLAIKEYPLRRREPMDAKIAASIKRVEDPLPEGLAVAIQPVAVTSPVTVRVDEDRKVSQS